MRLLLLTLLIIVLSLAGCRPYPRYRTGGETRRATPDESPTQSAPGYTTNDYLRLGAIMRSYLGQSHSSRTRYGSGFDCSQLVREVFKRFDGRILPRTAATQYQAGVAVHVNHLAYGDLVFFETDHRTVSHVGIYLGDKQFLHASTSRGVVISSLSENYWAKRFVGARRILEKASSDPKP